MEELAPEIKQRMFQIIEKVPDLPLSAGKVIEMADASESTLSEFASLVSSDPGLASNILKVVNSSYYALQNKTDNLRLAIVLLGFKEVRRIAVQSFFRRMLLDSQVHREFLRQLWDHSYLVSVCAESLCSPENQQKRGVYLTLGLLHDIGKFVLFSISQKMNPGAVSALESNSADKKYKLEKEELLFQVNHALVGSLLVEKWNLSKRFVSVLQFHHSPSFYGLNEIPREYLEEIATISIADLLVNRYMGTDELPLPHPHFFELLGFEPSLEQMLTEERRAVLDNACKFVSELH